MAPAENPSVHGQCDELIVPVRAWQLMLVLAERYGWKSCGTAPPDEIAIDTGLWRDEPWKWDGRYTPAYGQQITKEDAAYFAAALERALPDVPDHDALEGKVSCSTGTWGWFAAESPDVGINPLEAFSGCTKGMLINFIAHCREEGKGGLWLYQGD